MRLNQNDPAWAVDCFSVGLIMVGRYDDVFAKSGTVAGGDAHDAALIAAVLIGIGFNALPGWRRADPRAGLAIVYYGIKESREGWRHVGASRPQ